MKGSLFRSDEMSLVQLFIQAEAARSTVQELGELGAIQFRDLNPDLNSFQRMFVADVRRCEEMERKLRFLFTQLENAKIKVAPSNPREPSRTMQQMNELNLELTDMEERVKQMNANEEVIRRNAVELTELKYVLQEASSVFQNTNAVSSSLTIGREDVESPLLAGEDATYRDAEERSLSTVSISGVIAREHLPSFERILWRTLRGNMFLQSTPIPEDLLDPVAEKPIAKDVFMVVVHGEHTMAKVRKICDSFQAHIYPTPTTPQERADVLDQVNQRMSDIQSVLARTEDHRRRTLSQLALHIASWSDAVKKEKATFVTLNLFSRDHSSKCYVAEGWVPTNMIGEVQLALRRGTETAKTLVPTVMNVMTTKETPPTHFTTNKYTEGFQNIVEAYGVATYREMNPTPFSIITFPFLFGVMFGDLGHALIMTIAAGLLVYKEKQLSFLASGEMTGIVYTGRYIILLMGIFSMYVGFIYNDIFSKVMGIFPSGWDFPHDTNSTSVVGTFNGFIYPLGLDVGWHGAENLLIFTNSYKMKMSIIMGVVQMSVGIVLSATNHLHFKRMVSVWHEFVPQMLFMQSIFGYLVICILYKWCVDWIGLGLPAPSLLNMLIYMFLSPAREIEDPLYEGQQTVQIALLIIAFVCIPWMLLVKPFALRAQHNRQAKLALSKRADGSPRAAYSPLVEGDEHPAEVHDEVATSSAAPATSGGHGGGHGHDDEEFEFGEVFIHQVIHTIEFVLGSISNTASYLRLWALSLAHAQLSDVLWKMTLGNFISAEYSAMSVIGLWAMSAAWLVLTISILIAMEGLSAFLHALRLHWVEFNNKFYEGGGYKFHPFSYERILKGVDDE